MVETISTAIYVSLKGIWPADALKTAKTGIAEFFEVISHDTIGQTEIDETGLAYAYDAMHDGKQLEALLGALDAGPAFIVTIDVGDGLEVINQVKLPGKPLQKFYGTLSEDPSIPFSKRNDKAFIDALEAAIQLDAGTFTSA